ncbi:MAG TPA: RNA-binding S4 domain-containing protein [Opitutaceae bacterium]|jgi:ribosome-associated heat shock protein Hsp15
MDDARLDKLLWSLRLFKTRTAAADACDAGHVKINGQAVKPGRKVHPGEIMEIKLADLTRSLRVLALPRSRVGPKQVADCAEDLTPATEYERARQAARERAAARQQAGDGGRPTKKDRRSLAKLLGWEE